MRIFATAAVALAMLAGDLFTWLLFVLHCGVGENFTGAFAHLCGPNRPQPQVHLPLLGALLVGGGLIAELRFARHRVFALAVAFGLVSAATLWALYGDPAGHFSGLLS